MWPVQCRIVLQMHAPAPRAHPHPGCVIAGLARDPSGAVLGPPARRGALRCAALSCTLGRPARCCFAPSMLAHFSSPSSSRSPSSSLWPLPTSASASASAPALRASRSTAPAARSLWSPGRQSWPCRGASTSNAWTGCGALTCPRANSLGYLSTCGELLRVALVPAVRQPCTWAPLQYVPSPPSRCASFSPLFPCSTCSA